MAAATGAAEVGEEEESGAVGRGDSPLPPPEIRREEEGPLAPLPGNQEIQWKWEEARSGRPYPTLHFHTRMDIFKIVTEELKENGQLLEKYRNSCFGHFLNFDEKINVSTRFMSKLLRQEIIVADAKPFERWFRIGDQNVRFGKLEWCMLTGLRFGKSNIDPSNPPGLPKDSLFLRRRIEGANYNDLLRNFMNHAYAGEDNLKIALILTAHSFVLCREYRSPVPRWLWVLVEDLEKWNAFPWGSYTMQKLFYYMDHAFEKHKQSAYNFYCLFIPLQHWAYERIVSFRDSNGRRKSDDAFPRGARWKSMKLQINVDHILEHGQVELDDFSPTPEEQLMSYMDGIDRDILDGVIYLHNKRMAEENRKRKLVRLRESREHPVEEEEEERQVRQRTVRHSSADSGRARERTHDADLHHKGGNDQLHVARGAVPEELFYVVQNFVQKINDQHQRHLGDIYQAHAKVYAQRDEYFTKLEKKLTDSMTSTKAELVEFLKNNNYVPKPVFHEFVHQFMAKLHDMCHKVSESPAPKDQVTANCHLEQTLRVMASVQDHPHPSDIPNRSDQDLNDPLSEVCNYVHLANMENDGLAISGQVGAGIHQPDLLNLSDSVLANDQRLTVRKDVHPVIQAGNAAETPCRTQAPMMLDPSHAVQQETTTTTEHPHQSEVSDPVDIVE